MGCVGPKSGSGGKYLSHAFSKKAKEKSREMYKENPAYASLKMKGKKKSNLPFAKGKAQKAMAEQGLA